MRRRAAISLVTLAALALAPAAAAKEPVTLEICGESACTKFPERRHERLVRGVFAVVDTFAFAPPPTPAAYYELGFKEKWVRDWLGTEPMLFVPSRGAMYVGGEWRQVRPPVARRLDAATRRLAPWPRPRVTAVVVDGRRAPDPAPYEALLRALPAIDFGWSPRRVPIVLRSHRVTPWTDPARPIDYYPEDRAIHREGEWLRVPGDLARVIERDAGLVRHRRESTPPFPWPDLAAAGGAALVAFVIAAARVRRARRASPARA